MSEREQRRMDAETLERIHEMATSSLSPGMMEEIDQLLDELARVRRLPWDRHTGIQVTDRGVVR
jgi:hypothetical protein